jgi:hypothetical protein
MHNLRTMAFMQMQSWQMDACDDIAIYNAIAIHQISYKYTEMLWLILCEFTHAN